MWVVKECTKCKEVKLISEFHKNKNYSFGVRAKCKSCLLSYNKGAVKNWKSNNKEYIKKYNASKKEYKADWYRKNKYKYSTEEHLESKRKKASDYREKCPQKIKESREKFMSSEKWETWHRNYTKTEKYRKYRREYQKEYYKRRIASDELFKLKTRIRGLISISFANKGFKKGTKSRHILGCSFETFKQHIERQFQKGMTWDNYGEWHLDHIIPMASANTEEDALKLNHYTNFQPLWAKDNLKKSDKILEPIQMKLRI